MPPTMRSRSTLQRSTLGQLLARAAARQRRLWWSRSGSPSCGSVPPFTDPLILTNESVALVCVVPPCPAHLRCYKPLADSLCPCAACAPDAWGVSLGSLGLQGRAQACSLHLYGARPGGRELPRHFFLFMCCELLPTLLANWRMMMRGEDALGETYVSVEHPATGLVFLVRLGPVRPCQVPHAGTEPWPGKGAGAPHRLVEWSPTHNVRACWCAVGRVCDWTLRPALAPADGTTASSPLVVYCSGLHGYLCRARARGLGDLTRTCWSPASPVCFCSQ